MRTWLAAFSALVLADVCLGAQPYGLRVVNVSSESLAITWTTETPVHAAIYYGAQPNEMTGVAHDIRGCRYSSRTHFVPLEGLAAGSALSFFIHSGDTLYALGNAPFTAQTAPQSLALPPLPSSTAFGEVSASDCLTPLGDFIVYARIVDGDGALSGPESALYAFAPDISATRDGVWALSLDRFMEQDFSQFFQYSAFADRLSVELVTGPGERAAAQPLIARKSFGDDLWQAPALCPATSSLDAPAGNAIAIVGEPECDNLPCGVWVSGSAEHAANARERYLACTPFRLDGGEAVFPFSVPAGGFYDFALAPVLRQSELHLLVTSEATGVCLASVAASSGTGVITGLELASGEYALIVDSDAGEERRFALWAGCSPYTPTPQVIGTPTPQPTFIASPTATPTPQMTQVLTPTPLATATPQLGGVAYARGITSLSLALEGGGPVGVKVAAYAVQGTALGNSLATLECRANGPRFTPGNAAPVPQPLLFMLEGPLPEFSCGDVLRYRTISGQEGEVFLPGGLSGLGGPVSLWAGVDGAAYYAAAPNRTGAPNQTASEAVGANDLAATTESIVLRAALPSGAGVTYGALSVCRSDLQRASDLRAAMASQGNDVRSLGRWNAVSQTYVSSIEVGSGLLIGDFILSPELPLRIEVDGALNFTLQGQAGASLPDLSLQSTQGSDYAFLALPLDAASYDAASLASAISNLTGVGIVSVALWNEVGQNWTEYLTAINFGSFPIAPGQVVRLEVDGSGLLDLSVL